MLMKFACQLGSWDYASIEVKINIPGNFQKKKNPISIKKQG